jgi:preprotein translocase subunit SecY
MHAQALIVFSRLGVYMRLPGVDAERFAQTVQSGGILGYIDALSGGSISRVGIFSLGARAVLSPDPGRGFFEVHA